MKLAIRHENKTLKTIELTPLQLKACKLTNQEPHLYLADKIERILNFTVEQAKQKVAKVRLGKATDEEIETLADELLAEEVHEEKEDNNLEKEKPDVQNAN